MVEVDFFNSTTCWYKMKDFIKFSPFLMCQFIPNARGQKNKIQIYKYIWNFWNCSQNRVIYDSQMKEMTHRSLTGGSVTKDQQLIKIPAIKCKKSEKEQLEYPFFQWIVTHSNEKGALETQYRHQSAASSRTEHKNLKKSEIDLIRTWSVQISTQFAVKRPKTNSQSNWKLNPDSGYIAFNTTVCK